MNVRATDRLIGDPVIVTVLPKSPQMVVKAVNKETSQGRVHTTQNDTNPDPKIK